MSIPLILSLVAAARLVPVAPVAPALAPRTGASPQPPLPDRALPDAEYARRRYAKRVLHIPMRDGVRLFALAYVPRDASVMRQYPIVLVRTPFSVGSEVDSIIPPTIAPDPTMLRDGYVFVHQEVRGRYRSEGTFENVRPDRSVTDARTDETTDAEDTIAWLLQHVAEHNGRVGLHGVSYGGFYAALAANSRHPAIAAVSIQAPVSDFWREDLHRNGAFQLTTVWGVPVFGTPRPAPTAAHWWAPALARIPQDSMAVDYRFLLGVGPLRNATQQWLVDDLFWRDLIAHPDYDAWWQVRALPPRLQAPRVPTLVLGGWFDAENLVGTLAVHRALAAARARAKALPVARAPLTLVMGPFGHRQWSARGVARTMHGDVVFGDSLEARLQREVEAPFFRRHLKRSGDASAVDASASDAPVDGALLFDTGTHAWRRFAAWPASAVASASQRWFLRANGALDAAGGSESASVVTWTSDPAHPVPSRCGGPTVEDGSANRFMSGDQRCVSSRADVMRFVSAPLTRDLTLAGAVSATLRFATSGTDADIVVKLVDIYPDAVPASDTIATRMRGYEQLVRGDVLRGRWRDGTATPRPFAANTPTTVRVTLPDVFHTVRAGHRLMLQVQSSWFPLIDRNPQTFVPNIYEAFASDFVSATHRLWVGGTRGSTVTLPVVR